MTRFRPGESGNPSGRSKGASLVARMVRDQTANGAAIVATVLQIATGRHAEIKSERSRVWALEWLADRCFGKAVQPIDIVEEPEHVKLTSYDFATLTDEEALAYERITEKILARCEERMGRELRTKSLDELQRLAGDEGRDALASVRSKTLEELVSIAEGNLS